MKPFSNRKPRRAGSSLIESVVAVGVLAVAVPLVFATLAGTSESSVAAQAESRSSWIVQCCIDEIRASREGRARFLDQSEPGQNIPASGGVAALAFSGEGLPIGKFGADAYQAGATVLDGQPVRFIAEIRGDGPVTTGGGPEMVRVRVTQEFPAAAPAERRQKIHFYTHVP